MRLTVIRSDITTVHADAIVNAANSSLLGGGGVDGAIHRKGGPEILSECIAIRNRQGGCATGEAVITTAGKLPAKFVIHTVGPVWNNGKSHENELLSQCYINCLKIAVEKNLLSIVFPNISTGIYHFPKEAAAMIAINAVKGFFENNPASSVKQVIFVCYDDENFMIYKDLGIQPGNDI